MFHRGWFLVDVPEQAVAHEIVRIVRSYGVVRALCVDAELAAGARLAEPGRVAGIIVLVDPDQNERLHALRSSVPCLPVLALCRPPTVPSLRTSWQLINTAQRLGVELAQLPVHVPNLMSFVQRALSASFLPHDGVARVVSELARARELSAREVQILAYCLGNEPRHRVRRRLGIAENTLKTQIRSLLRKCDERSVDALAKNVLRAALYERCPSHEPVSPWRPARAKRASPLASKAGPRLAESA
jgi:DNA-binding NarL/FixJ family response regulator